MYGICHCVRIVMVVGSSEFGKMHCVPAEEVSTRSCGFDRSIDEMPHPWWLNSKKKTH
jgi:hypothetical protein